MICRSCRTSMLSRLQQQQAATWSSSRPTRQLPIFRSQFRFYSSKGSNPDVAAPPPPPTPRQPAAGDTTAPSAVSSATPGVSQPLSTPGGVHTEAHPDAATKPTVQRPPSSCPAGTKMNGLNYFKNKPDVFAKEDSEYPDWLWDLLGDSSKQSKTEKGGVDISSMWIHCRCLIGYKLTLYRLEQEATKALREETRRSHSQPSAQDPCPPPLPRYHTRII